MQRGELGHLKCRAAAVAVAQEFPFRGGCISLNAGRNMCTAEGAIKTELATAGSCVSSLFQPYPFWLQPSVLHSFLKNVVKTCFIGLNI